MNIKLYNFWLQVLFISCLAAGGLLWYGPIAQYPSYHNFADTREMFGIANFMNVITNIPFVILGLTGSLKYIRLKPLSLPYLFFFSGIFLTGLGSAYYHLDPNTQTLFWDRLPMAITFMAFFGIVVSEYVGEKQGKYLLFPLILTGIISVIYWNLTELKGMGDVRPYVLVQFLPALIIPLITVYYSSTTLRRPTLYLVLLVYGGAKIFEFLDYPIYQLGHIISGHSIKHLIAAFGIYIILKKAGNTLSTISTNKYPGTS